MTLSELIERVEKLDRPSREVDFAIYQALRPEMLEWQDAAKTSADDYWFWMSQREYTASLDAAIALTGRVLPGWWWKVGTCCVSDDACIAPDFNSPIHGERLKGQFFPLVPGSEFDAGFDVDRRPPGNVPIALITALLLALNALSARERDDAP